MFLFIYLFHWGIVILPQWNNIVLIARKIHLTEIEDSPIPFLAYF